MVPLSESSALNSSQDIIVSGNGLAGNPDTGVVSIQGITNGTVVNVQDPQDVASGSFNITTQDLASSIATGFANQSLITGTPTVNSTASFTLNSIQTVMILISGTWTGTVTTEVSEDSGTTWEPRSIHVIGTSTFASAITGNVVGSMNAAGKTNVRVRATAAITGTAIIKTLVSDNPSNIYVANSIKLVDGSATPNVNTLAIKAGSVLSASTDTAAVITIRDTVTIQGPSGSPGTPSGGILTIQGVSGGTNVPVQQGTANTVANGWPIKITDGTNTAGVSSNGDVKTKDAINVTSQYRAQSVTTTAAQALGAASVLTNRKFISITPTNGTVYWGGSASVTTATGQPLLTNNTLFLSFTDIVPVYLISAGTVDVRILEAS